ATLACIVGPEERGDGRVTVRVLRGEDARHQESVALDELIDAVSKRLAGARAGKAS
ncbi:MAG: hypothetical protein JWM85_2029, partial [Acidimicrobiaceae bacterium]|nr:hypothetical protein [Acidimicrobiaceae bacterium]